jgi:hypothetical protein
MREAGAASQDQLTMHSRGDASGGETTSAIGRNIAAVSAIRRPGLEFPWREP